MRNVNWIHPVRGVQAVLAIVVLGLMGYGNSTPVQRPPFFSPQDFLITDNEIVASWWTSHWRQISPTEINFLVFAPAWSLFALVPLLLIPLKFNHVLNTPAGRYGIVALEGLTMLFWLGGFVALAVFLSGRICFGMVGYICM